MSSIRAFVAIELSDSLAAALAETQRRLKDRAPLPVRWTDPRGIHLTLKFLGDVDAGRMGAIEEAVTRAVAGTGPFRIALGALGGFPTLARPRVIWLGLEGDLPALERLQQRVERELAPLGFPPEGRPFTAHLTLGRVREGGKRPATAGAWPDVADLRGVGQTVEGVSLMRSDLHPTGAVYTRLAAFPLR